MAQRVTLPLSEQQRRELEDLRDHAAQAYLRERAAALLKINAGQSASAVARSGLLKPVYYETVCEWVKRYQAAGLPGLVIHAGRGRKPAFSPSAPDSRECS